MSKVIIIDNVWDNFKFQQKNGIYIKTWEGDKSDVCLFDLKILLTELVSKRVKDIRVSIQKLRDVMFRLYLEGVQCPYKALKKILIEQ